MEPMTLFVMISHGAVLVVLIVLWLTRPPVRHRVSDDRAGEEAYSLPTHDMFTHQQDDLVIEHDPNEWRVPH